MDGKRAKANQRLVAGQDVRVPPFVPQDKDAKPELSEADRAFIKSLVIYDEGGIVALNKPAGLATQGGTNIRHHIDGMLDGLADKDGVRPPCPPSGQGYVRPLASGALGGDGAGTGQDFSRAPYPENLLGGYRAGAGNE